MDINEYSTMSIDEAEFVMRSFASYDEAVEADMGDEYLDAKNMLDIDRYDQAHGIQ